jgi:hypothetical protein
MKTQKKYSSIKHSLSNPLMNIGCWLRNIEHVFKENDIDINSLSIGKDHNGKELSIQDGINDCRESLKSIHNKLTDYIKNK